jgi:hypothetical protein
MILPAILLGAATGLPIGWQTARCRGRAALRREMARARAAMRQEVIHWQAAAARATAEAARVAREAEAYKAGHQHGRQDVISIMPLLVAAQQHPPPEERASGDER